MFHRDNPYQVLADQAKRGDVAASTLLHKQLEPQVVFIVRHTLTQRSERTSLERQIFAAARRMGLESRPKAVEDRDFILGVARSVCNLVVGRLRPAAEAPVGAGETIRGS